MASKTRGKFFHTFEYSCMYDIKFTNMEIIKVNVSTITHGYLRFKFEFAGLKKNQKAQKKCFIFNQLMKITKIFDSTLSNTNRCLYKKLPIPKMH